MQLHPLQAQRDMARDWRNIGLGVSGVADLFIRMGYTYGSPHSIEVIRDIMRVFSITCLKQNSKRAMELGAYGAYKREHGHLILGSKYAKFILEEAEKIMPVSELMQLRLDILNSGLRNIAMTTVQPLGTGSLLLNTSNGIEPYFKLKKFIRKTESVHTRTRYYAVDDSDIYKEYKDIHPGTLVEASDIHWKYRINIQSAIQEYIDNSISSTVNLAPETTLDEMKDMYKYAYSKGLKGVTTFRPSEVMEGVLINAPDYIKDFEALQNHVEVMNDQVKDRKFTRAEIVARLKGENA